MSSLNKPNTFSERTHEGAPAARMTPEQALRRSVLSCLLWEREFYESGEDIATRIEGLAAQVDVHVLAKLAVEARSEYNLRHVPLLLLVALAKHQGPIVGETIAATIQRADELAEFLVLYWRKGKTPLSKQVKLGLAKAFTKFSEYNLAKYDRANAVRLRDVMFMVHPKPTGEAQAETWKRLAANELITPDTWEVALSGGADKKETFERLIREGKLGYLALLRNLRNMAQAGCDPELVKAAILARKGAERVLPFRYIAAARAAPQFEPALDNALCAAVAGIKPFSGKTVVLVDVSGSMDWALSAKSDLRRKDAACALASIIPGDRRVFSFADKVVEVPARVGMAGVDAIQRSQSGNTRLFDAVATINAKVPYDRLIVITDEQAFPAQGLYPAPRVWGRGGLLEQSVAARSLPDPKGLGYMINVASAKNGVGYGAWTHIDGFSEQVLRFIAETESQKV